MNPEKIKPVLSIITAVYQGRKHIAGCIESVIKQQHDSVEHIIMDGASTDGTAEIVRSYLTKYPHIRFISEKDNGQSSALNKGIRLARGRIIGILNSDDFYEPGAMKSAAGFLTGLQEPSLVVGNCNIRGENDKISNVQKTKRLKQWELLLGWELNPYPVNPSAYFYHKSLHEKIGYYGEDDHYTMDLVFILKAVAVARVFYVDECWGNFRYVPGTKTYESVKRGQNRKRIEEVFESFIANLPFLQRSWVRFLRRGKAGYFYYRLGYYYENPIDRVRQFLGRHLGSKSLLIKSEIHKQRPYGVVIIGLLLICTSIDQLRHIPSFSDYSVINQGLSVNMLKARFVVSYLLRIIGLVCGLGIIFLQERFRKTLIGLSVFSIATVFLRHTYGSFLLYTTPLYYHHAIKGYSLQAFTWICVLIRWSIEIAFSGISIYYLTRPNVKAYFK